METLRDERGSDKAFRAGREALAPIAAGLVALIRLFPEVRQALSGSAEGDDDAGDPWLDQKASPLGKRDHCRACASGAIEGARKVRRRWLARRSAIDAYIASSGRAAERVTVRQEGPANDTAASRGVELAREADEHQGDEPTAAEIERELAIVGMTAGSRGRRGRR